MLSELRFGTGGRYADEAKRLAVAQLDQIPDNFPGSYMKAEMSFNFGRMTQELAEKKLLTGAGSQKTYTCLSLTLTINIVVKIYAELRAHFEASGRVLGEGEQRPENDTFDFTVGTFPFNVCIPIMIPNGRKLGNPCKYKNLLRIRPSDVSTSTDVDYVAGFRGIFNRRNIEDGPSVYERNAQERYDQNRRRVNAQLREAAPVFEEFDATRTRVGSGAQLTEFKRRAGCYTGSYKTGLEDVDEDLDESDDDYDEEQKEPIIYPPPDHEMEDANSDEVIEYGDPNFQENEGEGDEREESAFEYEESDYIIVDEDDMLLEEQFTSREPQTEVKKKEETKEEVYGVKTVRKPKKTIKQKKKKKKTKKPNPMKPRKKPRNNEEEELPSLMKGKYLS